MHLHNEIEPFAALWLENLATAGTIPPSHVDRKSIADLTGSDFAGYAQVHFFAGIGGWSHALKLAGWPAEKPVWTGSCPCQPFSVAGKGAGTDDARHLWPEMRRLIGECLPPVVFGEQVGSKAGRAWLAGVQADMEALGYAFGSADLCAAGIGAPHIRQRLYWGAVRLADAERGSAERHGYQVASATGSVQSQTRKQRLRLNPGDGLDTGRLADTDDTRSQGRQLLPERKNERAAGPCGMDGWADAVWLECLDGKTRRIPAEPELFPLAHGLPGRVGRLRAYGNAIVPALAAEFVMSFMEAAGLPLPDVPHE